MTATAATDVAIRLATPGDAGSFVDLFNAHYRRTIGPQYVHWQFFSPDVRAVLLLGCDGQEVVAAHGTQQRSVWTHAGRTEVLFNVDSMIRPSHRNLTLYQQLIAAGANGHAASSSVGMLCMANEAACAVLTRLLGWTRIATLVTTVRPTSDVPPAVSGLDFRSTTADDPALAEIAAGFRASHRDLNAFERSGTWIHWRFAEHPQHRYEVILAARHGHPWAWMVLKTFHDPVTNMPFGDLVDLAWTHDDPELLAGLLGHAIQRFRDQGVDTISTWLQTHTLLDDVGRRLGFADTAQRRYFCGKPSADAAARELLDASRWFLTFADAEIY